mgnify:FL=1
MIKYIEEMEYCLEDLKDTIRAIAKEFIVKPFPEGVYSANTTQYIYTQFFEKLYDKIVAQDILSRQLDEITNYLLRQYELIAHLLEQRDDLKQININLTEKYEELENKYKTMERNFYDAFS